MKFILLATTFAITAYAAPTDEWNHYKAKYNKVYSSETENTRRLEQYLKTKEMVEEHNRKYDRGETIYTMGINQFSDSFPEEFNRLNGLKLRESVPAGKPLELPPGTVVPDSINWVTKGAVTSVKNEGACPSGYAFSTAGVLEGLMFIKNHTLKDLSSQQLLDCTLNFGCEFGVTYHCFSYVLAKGIETDEAYPYAAKTQHCRADGRQPVFRYSSYKYVTDEEDLKNVVGTLGPVSIGFAADKNFRSYEGGIYEGSCDQFHSHYMLAVGYGTDEKTKKDYWLVKNSWGTQWGEKGYVRIIRNKNLCQLADKAIYALAN